MEIVARAQVRGRLIWGETDSMLRTYLRDIRKVPLLTREEEIAIARRIAKSRWVARQRKRLEGFGKKTGKPSREIVIRLQKAEEDAEKARQELVLSNLRLVVSIAKKYVNRGLSLMDLIQECNLGLIRAVEKYDVRTGNKFSTYAVWWIRQAAMRAIADKSRVIRIPVHMVDICNQVARHGRESAQLTGHEATPHEIAARMGIPLEKVTEALRVANASAVLSLERPIGEADEGTPAQFIRDPNAVSPVGEILSQEMTHKIRKALQSLSPREEKVLKMRFGIDVPNRASLGEVGRMFSVTRERIRQIEANALRKLRASAHWLSLRKMLISD